MNRWQPGADHEALRQRAALLADIRSFFADRHVLEVDTPLLCSSGVTDPALEPLLVEQGRSLTEARYLQTSPEYAMKRLLASGSGPIYQIAHAFRDDESGRRHNPEFTLLEWYRPNLDHHALMEEVAALVGGLLAREGSKKYSYRELFAEFVAVDPFSATAAELEAAARKLTDAGNLQGSREFWLDMLLTHAIEPALADLGMVFVYDYPAPQAALARIVEVDGVSVGQRFELYVDGVELANGYCELTDATEQRRRFEEDNRRRLVAGKRELPIDDNLLAAMASGLPDCSGVALGIDRLLMLKTGIDDIRRVQSFSWDRC
ncbi:MAG: EF-P lysine aminoacylase EpmA [Halieaceae bacterium]